MTATLQKPVAPSLKGEVYTVICAAFHALVSSPNETLENKVSFLFEKIKHYAHGLRLPPEINQLTWKNITPAFLIACIQFHADGKNVNFLALQKKLEEAKLLDLLRSSDDEKKV